MTPLNLQSSFSGTRILRLCILSTLLLIICSLAKSQVVDYTTNIEIDKGIKVTEKTIVLQINNHESSWQSKIKIPYSKNQKCEILEAYITSSDGTIERKLKKKEIETRSDISRGSFFEDDYIKEFTLSWNQYPYRLTYKYRITDLDFIYIAKWYPVINPSIPVNQAKLIVTLPIGYVVNQKYPEVFKYKYTETDKKQILEWNLSNYKPGEPEIYSLPELALIPNVTIVPKVFKYSIQGNSETWSSFGNWQSQLIEGTDILPEYEKRIVDNLIQGIYSKEKIIRILFHYLQDNTRYINVAIDVGGLKPYPASYVCSNKYGDCKALTIYMKALLRHAGIDSYYTTVFSGSNPIRVDSSIPSQQFNHVILTIPNEGDTIWLENTSNFLPFNYLGTFTQSRRALLCDSINSKLIWTPSLSNKDVLDRRFYKFNLNKSGNGSVSIRRLLRGEHFEMFQYYNKNLNSEEIKQKIVEELEFRNFELDSWSIKQDNRDSQELNLSMRISIRDYFRDIGNMIIISPIRMDVPKFEDVEKRKTSIVINYPINRRDSSIYDIHISGTSKIEVPKNSEIESPFGSYKEHYILKDGRIYLNKSFFLKKGIYNLNQYQDFKFFIDSIQNQQNQSLIILTY